MGWGFLGGEQGGQGTQEDCPAFSFTVSGFMAMGLVSWLSPVHHSEFRLLLSGSHVAQPNCDASEKNSGRWKDAWCLLLTLAEFSLSVLARWCCVPHQDPLS